MSIVNVCQIISKRGYIYITMKNSCHLKFSHYCQYNNKYPLLISKTNVTAIIVVPAYSDIQLFYVMVRG